MMNIEHYIEEKAGIINKELNDCIENIKNSHPVLSHAMLYSINAGGKRIRPAMLMAAYEIFGRSCRDVICAACAIEMVHTYSLIHDDLPAMDNDDLRRGKPTNHMVYGEAAAILAGDGLLTDAFRVLYMNSQCNRIKKESVLKAVEILARSAGSGGMVGGQMADLEAERSERFSKIIKFRQKTESPKRLLEYIHTHKTSDLIRASVEIGSMLAGAPEHDFNHLSNYGKLTGLVFQIVDDVLDVTGDKKKLGKSGSDAKNRKLTYATMFGVEKARKIAGEFLDMAHKELFKLKRPEKKIGVLHEIADYIYFRDR